MAANINLTLTQLEAQYALELDFQVAGLPMSRNASSFSVVLLTLALTACGGSSPPQQQGKAAKAVEKAIYISAADCADAGKLNPDVCSALIERTVKEHVKTAQVFKGLRSCEEASGPDRCERDADGNYRMRLQAFMFELGPQPIVTPLYPSAEGKVGFRDAKKKPVDARDDNLLVSQQSLQIAFENSKLGKKR